MSHRVPPPLKKVLIPTFIRVSLSLGWVSPANASSHSYSASATCSTGDFCVYEHSGYGGCPYGVCQAAAGVRGSYSVPVFIIAYMTFSRRRARHMIAALWRFPSALFRS